MLINIIKIILAILTKIPLSIYVKQALLNNQSFLLLSIHAITL